MLVVALAIVATLLLVVMGRDRFDAIYTHSSVVYPAIPLIIAIYAWWTRRGRMEARGWGWVLAGMTGFFVYDCLWYWSQFVDGTMILAYADLSNLMFAPLVLIGVIRGTRAPATRVEQRRRLLDAGVLTIGAVTLLYTAIALLGGGLKAVRSPRDLLLLVAPLNDLLTLGGLAWVWVRRDGRTVPGWTRTIGVALLTGLVSDVWYALPYSAGRTSPWFVAAAWYVNWATLGVGAAQAMRPDARIQVAFRLSRLPYILAVACYLGLALSVALSNRDATVAATIGVGVMTVLVLVRQYLAMADLTHMQDERMRLESDARLAALVRHGSDLLTILDASGTIRYASPSHQQVFGLTADELVGRSILGDLHEDDVNTCDESIQRLLQGESPRESVVVRVRNSDGEYRWIEAMLTNLLHEQAINGLVVNSRDVTDRMVLEEQLREQALRDPLTGLGNRRLFGDRVASALARHQDRPELVAVILFDLDHFKFINDSLGHAQGDALLVEVADRLRRALRSTDTVARLGGDEFAVLIEAVASPDEAELTAARIEDALENAFLLNDREITVRASIGIAWATPGQSVDGLLTDADVAMYGAKNAGRSRIERYSAAMRAKVAERHTVEADLRRAIDRNEFEVVYQPVVDLLNGRIVGAEALIRWRHPKHGDVMPDRFIRIAEDCGLIVDVGRVVLMHAARDAAWFREHCAVDDDFRVAVNMSARQLLSAELVGDVASALAVAGVPGSALLVELTESVLAENESVVAGRLESLRRMGLRVALDDFGTGYSALAYLRRFPIDVLKVDRSFVSWVASQNADDGVTRAILAMGQSLSMETVGEGVETLVQLNWLQGLGCTMGQGYLFSEPVPFESFVRLMRTWDASRFSSMRDPGGLPALAM